MKNLIEIPELEIQHQDVVTDILSQSITGELIGMSNFASLAGVIDDVHEKMELWNTLIAKDSMRKAIWPYAKKIQPGTGD